MAYTFLRVPWKISRFLLNSLGLLEIPYVLVKGDQFLSEGRRSVSVWEKYQTGMAYSKGRQICLPCSLSQGVSKWKVPMKLLSLEPPLSKVGFASSLKCPKAWNSFYKCCAHTQLQQIHCAVHWLQAAILHASCQELGSLSKLQSRLGDKLVQSAEFDHMTWWCQGTPHTLGETTSVDICFNRGAC